MNTDALHELQITRNGGVPIGYGYSIQGSKATKLNQLQEPLIDTYSMTAAARPRDLISCHFVPSICKELWNKYYDGLAHLREPNVILVAHPVIEGTDSLFRPIWLSEPYIFKEEAQAHLKIIR